MPQTILIADDDPLIRRTMTDLLGRAGYDVHALTSGDRVVSAAREHAPDLIIIDVLMPGADGYTVLAHLQSEIGLTEIPVILTSGEPEEIHLPMGSQFGAAGFLAKPLEARRVLDTIEAVLGQPAKDVP